MQNNQQDNSARRNFSIIRGIFVGGIRRTHRPSVLHRNLRAASTNGLSTCRNAQDEWWMRYAYPPYDVQGARLIETLLSGSVFARPVTLNP